jgi:hypothetical protein
MTEGSSSHCRLWGDKCKGETEIGASKSKLNEVKIPTPSTSLRAGSNVAKNATLGWGTLSYR